MTCCICGHHADENAGGLLINGKTLPVCEECANILDRAEGLDPKDPQHSKLHAQLREKLISCDAGSAVIETVNSIFANARSQDIPLAIASELLEPERDEPEADAVTTGSSIESLCSFLTVFAVISLIGGIVLSLIIGVPLAQQRLTQASGWSVIIGGIIGTVLMFAMIMLVLSVASAIGRINAKLDDTNAQLTASNKHLARIASMLSAENRKQKKS